jgi:GTP-binding protein EngB required for normal cell division
VHRIIDEERPRWEIEHALHIDEGLRQKQSVLVDKFTSPLKLCREVISVAGISYSHYYISDGYYVLEFGGAGVASAAATEKGGSHYVSDGYYVLEFGGLCISLKKENQQLNVVKEFANTGEVKCRMRLVLGATNHSWCLRNSEHVARYIQSGTWHSLQMTGDDPLFKAFKGALGEKVSLVNTLPKDLQPKRSRHSVTGNAVYQAWCSPYDVEYTGKSPSLIPQDGDVNVVVLGPTGSGKSSIINALFNKRVCPVKASALSVTRQMEIYSGYMKDAQRVTKKLNVIDTIGFCDSIIPPEEIMALVKQFIRANVVSVHKVVIVCSGRIEAAQATQIKHLLQWLGYSRHKSEFVFIYNKAEDLDDDEKTECIGEMCTLLDVQQEYGLRLQPPDQTESIAVNFALATGFPPRAPLEDVIEDLTRLNHATLCFRKDQKAIRVDESSCPIL